MNKITKALEFIRITDERGRLSLTNIALVVVLGRLIMSPEVATFDLLSFVAAMVGYHVKRFAADEQPADSDTAALKAAIESLQTKVTGLELGSQTRRR